MELGVAIGLGAWFLVMSIVATVRVFKDYNEQTEMHKRNK